MKNVFLALALLGAPAALADEPASCPPGMLLVPGGPFTMGDPQGFPDEQPPLQLTLKSFCLDATEVTVAAYAACAHAGPCTPAHAHPEFSTLKSQEMKRWSELCNTERTERLTHPVNCVVWDEGARYCAAQGLRLPTEAEWEYAARGGDEERRFPWGAAVPSAELANLCGTECAAAISLIRGSWSPLYPQDDGFVGTAPVGSFRAGDGRWGHHDLTGNVCEWVSGAYCPYGHPDCGAQTPMCRGNHFLANNVKKARPARRNTDDAQHRDASVGFRCAAEVGSAPSPTGRGERVIGPDLPSFPRVALAVAWALLAGLGVARLRGAATLVMGTLVFFEQLDPQMAISTGFLVLAAAYAAALVGPATRRRVRAPVALPLALTTFSSTCVAAALAGFLPARAQLGLLSLAMLGLAVQLTLRFSLTALVTAPESPLVLGALSGLVGFAPGLLFEAQVSSRASAEHAGATTLPVLLAASLGGALGAGLHTRPEPGLLLVMAGVAAGGALVKSFGAPREMRRAGVLLMAFTLFAFGSIIFVREILPASWVPWL